MDNGFKSDEQEEREDQATDSRTLDQVEEEQKVPADNSNSPTPSPDEGNGRGADDAADQPM